MNVAALLQDSPSQGPGHRKRLSQSDPAVTQPPSHPNTTTTSNPSPQSQSTGTQSYTHPYPPPPSQPPSSGAPPSSSPSSSAYPPSSSLTPRSGPGQPPPPDVHLRFRASNSGNGSGTGAGHDNPSPAMASLQHPPSWGPPRNSAPGSSPLLTSPPSSTAPPQPGHPAHQAQSSRSITRGPVPERSPVVQRLAAPGGMSTSSSDRSPIPPLSRPPSDHAGSINIGGEHHPPSSHHGPHPLSQSTHSQGPGTHVHHSYSHSHSTPPLPPSHSPPTSKLGPGAPGPARIDRLPPPGMNDRERERGFPPPGVDRYNHERDRYPPERERIERDRERYGFSDRERERRERDRNNTSPMGSLGGPGAGPYAHHANLNPNLNGGMAMERERSREREKMRERERAMDPLAFDLARPPQLSHSHSQSYHGPPQTKEEAEYMRHREREREREMHGPRTHRQSLSNQGPPPFSPDGQLPPGPPGLHGPGGRVMGIAGMGFAEPLPPLAPSHPHPSTHPRHSQPPPSGHLPPPHPGSHVHPGSLPHPHSHPSSQPSPHQHAPPPGHGLPQQRGMPGQSPFASHQLGTGHPEWEAREREREWEQRDRDRDRERRKEQQQREWEMEEMRLREREREERRREKEFMRERERVGPGMGIVGPGVDVMRGERERERERERIMAMGMEREHEWEREVRHRERERERGMPRDFDAIPPSSSRDRFGPAQPGAQHGPPPPPGAMGHTHDRMGGMMDHRGLAPHDKEMSRMYRGGAGERGEREIIAAEWQRDRAHVQSLPQSRTQSPSRDMREREREHKEREKMRDRDREMREREQREMQREREKEMQRERQQHMEREREVHAAAAARMMPPGPGIPPYGVQHGHHHPGHPGLSAAELEAAAARERMMLEMGMNPALAASAGGGVPVGPGGAGGPVNGFGEPMMVYTPGATEQLDEGLILHPETLQQLEQEVLASIDHVSERIKDREARMKMRHVNLGTYVWPKVPFPFYWPDKLPSVDDADPGPEEEGDKDNKRKSPGDESAKTKEKERVGRAQLPGQTEVRVTIIIPSAHLPRQRLHIDCLWGGGLLPPPPLASPFVANRIIQTPHGLQLTHALQPGTSVLAQLQAILPPPSALSAYRRRVYTDDSDLVTCAVHSGLLTWSALARAIKEKRDLRLDVALVRTIMSASWEEVGAMHSEDGSAAPVPGAPAPSPPLSNGDAAGINGSGSGKGKAAAAAVNGASNGKTNGHVNGGGGNTGPGVPGIPGLPTLSGADEHGAAGKTEGPWSNVWTNRFVGNWGWAFWGHSSCGPSPGNGNGNGKQVEGADEKQSEGAKDKRVEGSEGDEKEKAIVKEYTGADDGEIQSTPEDDGRCVVSAGWGWGHDGSGIEVLRVEIVEPNSAHKGLGLGRRNRAQRLAEYTERRTEVLSPPRSLTLGDRLWEKSSPPITLDPFENITNGRRKRRRIEKDWDPLAKGLSGSKSRSQSQVQTYSQQDYADAELLLEVRQMAARTVLFGLAKEGENAGYKYDPETITSALFPSSSDDALASPSPPKRRKLDADGEAAPMEVDESTSPSSEVTQPKVEGKGKAIVLDAARESYVIMPVEGEDGKYTLSTLVLASPESSSSSPSPLTPEASKASEVKDAKPSEDKATASKPPTAEKVPSPEPGEITGEDLAAPSEGASASKLQSDDITDKSGPSKDADTSPTTESTPTATKSTSLSSDSKGKEESPTFQPSTHTPSQSVEHTIASQDSPLPKQSPPKHILHPIRRNLTRDDISLEKAAVVVKGAEGPDGGDEVAMAMDVDDLKIDVLRWRWYTDAAVFA